MCRQITSGASLSSGEWSKSYPTMGTLQYAQRAATLLSMLLGLKDKKSSLFNPRAQQDVEDAINDLSENLKKSLQPQYVYLQSGSTEKAG